jgi:glycosyltransferase involved in cell wall biosynthesis
MLTYTVYERDTRVRRYAEYLAADGHDVDVLCLASDMPEIQSTQERVRLFPLPITRSRREGLRLVINWAFALITMFLRTTILDIQYRYDLIHVHNMPDLLVFCALFPRLRGCPVILNIHDPTPELARSKLGLSQKHPMIRIQAALEWISAKFSSHVITATPSFEKLLITRGIPREKITVITNAADPRFFHLDQDVEIRSRSGDCFTVLYVGTVAHRYGLHICVQALAQVAEEVPGIRLRVVPKIRNEGKGLEECIELAHRLSISSRFVVDNPVPLEQMPSVMRSADIGVYPATP